MNYRHHPQIGFEIPIITPAVRGAWDVVTSVFDRVPGSDWIKDATRNGTTFLADMARDDRGRFLLQAITVTYLYGPLAGTPLPGAVGQVVVGPVVASLVWALPGMIAGESFTEAYTKELAEKIQGLAEYFGGKKAGELFANQLKGLIDNPQFKDAMASVRARFGNIAGDAVKRALIELNLTPEQLAKQFNVSPDVAAAAINHFFRENVYDINRDYDKEGDPVDPIAKERLQRDLVEANLPAGIQISRHRLLRSVILARDPIPTGAGTPTDQGRTFFGQLVTAALLTSPLWFSVFVLSRIRNKR